MKLPLGEQPGQILHKRISDDFGYASGNLVYRLAKKADDEQLRSMLRENEMDSWVQMTLEREPSYFAGDFLLGQDLAVLATTAQAPHQPVGMFAYGLRPLHVNGQPLILGYVGQLRVHPASRNRIQVLKRGYQALWQLTRNIEPPYSFTSIASENSAALRLLNANLNGMPIYTPQGQYLTLAIAISQTPHSNSAVAMHPACKADVPELVDFHNRQASRWQFAPALSQQWLLSLDPRKGLAIEDFLLLRRHGEICACLAVWDQRAMKQTVARGYRFPINLLRRPHNLLARISRRIELPAVGRQLEQAYLAFAAFGRLSETETMACICHGLELAKNKNAKAAVIGLSTRNPLTEKLQRHFKAVSYRSEIETVSWPQNHLPSIDGRPVQPEVALL